MSGASDRKADWRVRIGVPIGTLVYRLLGLTWRRNVHGADALRALRAGGKGFVLASWHANQLASLYQHRGEGIRVLVSDHRDGEIIARVVEAMGFGTVRGSTSRGGARALVEMIRFLRSGGVIGITPDGPRGPAGRFAPGALVSAQRAGVPVILMAVTVKRAWRLRSWDRFTIPKPFASITIRYSAPTTVGGDSAAEAAAESSRFEAMMAELERASDA